VRAAEELALAVGPVAAADALGVSRATMHRRRRPPAAARPRIPSPSPRALAPAERDVALGLLHEDRFVDRAPASIVAVLLDEGRYVASERTLYRLLAENDEVRERRDQLCHPPRAVPRLCATAPRQVWTWDITPLPGPVRGIFFQLYVMLDLFSRYVVSWMVAARQTGELAADFVKNAVEREGIKPGTLISHTDRGSPMTSRSLAITYAELGVTPSKSRPRVSDDNPFSESHFKTAKYHPSYPDQFTDEEHSRAHFDRFFRWYNHDHRHGGIATLTPADVHFGRVNAVLAKRQAALDAAFAAHPERFPNGAPIHPRPASEVWINPPLVAAQTTEVRH
jgi:putative transposase